MGGDIFMRILRRFRPDNTAYSADKSGGLRRFGGLPAAALPAKRPALYAAHSAAEYRYLGADADILLLRGDNYEPPLLGEHDGGTTL